MDANLPGLGGGVNACVGARQIQLFWGLKGSEDAMLVDSCIRDWCCSIFILPVRLPCFCSCSDRCIAKMQNA